MKDEMKIRLIERIRVYKDSPALQATYIDLVHLIEDLLEMDECNKEVGFNPQ